MLFEKHGLQLQYPENWKREESETEEGGWTLSLQSPGSVFFFLHGTSGTSESLLENALLAMKQDYPDLESTPVKEKIAGKICSGFDITFFTLDMVTDCQLRVLKNKKESYLLMFQQCQTDEDRQIQVLGAIKASLRIG